MRYDLRRKILYSKTRARLGDANRNVDRFRVLNNMRVDFYGGSAAQFMVALSYRRLRSF